MPKPEGKGKVPPIDMARQSAYLKVPATNGKQDWEDMLDDQSEYKSEKSYYVKPSARSGKSLIDQTYQSDCPTEFHR